MSRWVMNDRSLRSFSRRRLRCWNCLGGYDCIRIVTFELDVGSALRCPRFNFFLGVTNLLGQCLRFLFGHDLSPVLE